MRFLTRSETATRFAGKSVAVVGSGPGVLKNRIGFIDSHDVVLRINNYKITPQTGRRTDVFYSFFGTSIKKTARELKEHGVTLCMSKIPDAHAIQSDWHQRNGMMIGVDYRPHFQKRADWWFCDTYIPTVEEFLSTFHLLGRHVATTGFSAIVDVLSFRPRSVYITGFDFFRSGIHNVNEKWRPGRADDPIKHVPEIELKWLADNASRHPVSFDAVLESHVNTVRSAA